jgi:S1-C subfamily serine protease
MSTHEPGNETQKDPEQYSPGAAPAHAAPYNPYNPYDQRDQRDPFDQHRYSERDMTAPYGRPGDTPPYGPYGGDFSAGSAAGATSMPGYGRTPEWPYVAQEQAPATPASKTHRLRNGLVVAAMLVAALGGGIAAGRATYSPTSSAAGTSNAGGTSPSGGSSGGSSLLPGSSGGSGSGGFPGFFGGSGGSSLPGSSTGSGGSTGVGAGGGSLNASSISSKVDPGLVDVNVVLGYQSEGAAGTGIVLTSNGEVLTNNHVVDGATSIRVTDIGNGKTYTAKVVGTDATADIAVIQLENASGLTTANLGDSSTLKTGEPVLAIGNAGGVGGTPSTAAGSVVALDQSITATDDSGGNSENLTGLVETNAPIQPGDSGGPLVNSSGQVLAIDTAASGGSQFQSTSSQAYAIPIDTALTIAHEIESGQGSSTIHIGEAGMLGVEVEGTGSNGTSSGAGALIVATVSGSPAAGAGLVAGDVIVSLNGQAVDSPTDLSSLMNSHHPGDQVTLGYDDSSGQLHTVTLTLAAGPPA